MSARPGRLELELQNTNAHDKWVFTAGRLILRDQSAGAELVINKAPGFHAPAGAVFKIVEMPGTNTVDGALGTFAGLPDGNFLTVDDTNFRIHYRGGDGNDITLKVFAPPPYPHWHHWHHGPTGLTLHLTNTPGRLNFLESINSLATPIKWTRIATNLTPASGMTNFHIPHDPRQNIRFFRMASE